MDSSVVVAFWARKGLLAVNWGDLLNPHLINKLSEMPVVHVDDVTSWNDRPVYRVVGSSLELARPNDIIWGHGFITHGEPLRNKPMHVAAVRGPLTRQRMLDAGVPCPEIYGDPAVLYPLIYYPKIEKTHDYGLIQHFREFATIAPFKIAEDASVRLIDIRSGIRRVVDEIVSCKRIISSSLHGLICAHAYGIPAYWVKASDLPAGDDFKFEDYYRSIGYDAIEPLGADQDGVVKLRDFPCLPGDDVIDAEDLLNACPFMSFDRKAVMIRTFRKLRQDGKAGTIFRAYEPPV